MSAEQQNKCLALLLAIAFDASTSKVDLQQAIRNFLRELPSEDIQLAAGTKVAFSP